MKEELHTRYRVSGAKIKEFALASLDAKLDYIPQEDRKAVAPLSFVLVPVFETLKSIMSSKRVKSLLMLPVRISVRWSERFYEGDVLDVYVSAGGTGGEFKSSFRVMKDKKKVAEGKIYFKEFKRR